MAEKNGTQAEERPEVEPGCLSLHQPLHKLFAPLPQRLADSAGGEKGSQMLGMMVVWPRFCGERTERPVSSLGFRDRPGGGPGPAGRGAGAAGPGAARGVHVLAHCCRPEKKYQNEPP